MTDVIYQFDSNEIDERNFSRPLFRKNGNKDYPLSKSGTGVVLGLGVNKVVVTASHIAFDGGSDRLDIPRTLTTVMDLDGK